MSTSYKVIIAAAAILILASSGLFIFTQNRAANVPNLTTKSSSSIQILSTASNIKSLATSSLAQSTSKVTEAFKNSSVSDLNSRAYNLPNTEIVDGVQVTYLDSANPPQYIKDYLKCQAKLLGYNISQKPLSGLFIAESNLIEYKCPPDKQCQGITGLWYNLPNKNWECINPMGGERGACFGLEMKLTSPIQDSNLQLSMEKIRQKIFTENVTQISKDNCIIFIKEPLSNEEKIILANNVPQNIKLTIYQQN